MSSSKIRVPKQQRSIDKKRKIVEAGFSLLCQKGYHNTNTAEIAKAAGVSTGIVYSYFKDKKDIFMKAVELYADSMTSQLYNSLKELKQPLDMAGVIGQIIDIFVKSHTLSKGAHDEMLAMSFTDDDVREYFRFFKMNTANHIVEFMTQFGLKPQNILEKVHISIDLIEQYCHEAVYNKSEQLDYDIMKNEIIKIIIMMMTH